MGPVSEEEAVVVVVSTLRGQWYSMLSALLATCQVISRAGPLERRFVSTSLSAPGITVNTIGLWRWWCFLWHSITSLKHTHTHTMQ